MSDKSAIEWTDATWNPIVGCSIVSPGCTNCYAMKMAARIERMRAPERRGDAILPHHYTALTEPSKAGPVWTGRVNIAPDHILTQPLRWKRGRKIFVNSMGDLFHESIPDEWIDRVFAIMALCPQHTFKVLTKRAERMRDYSASDATLGRVLSLTNSWLQRDGKIEVQHKPDGLGGIVLPNVWLGVSTERQQEADERIPLLLQTPAAVRFISAEPLLGPISLRWAKWDDWKDASGKRRQSINHLDGARMLDWVIVGGESGSSARPMHPDWARSLRDQCGRANVPFFYKQTGEWLARIDRDTDDPDWRHDYTVVDSEPRRFRILNLAGGHGFHGDRVHLMERVGKKAAGRLLDGREHNEFPEARV